MTETSTAAPLVAPVAERIVFALRQAALLGVALLVAGLVTERLRPDQMLDRGIASTPFLWAIVLWFAALLFNAIAFDQPHTRALEGTPLFAAAGIGAVVFLTGLITLDGGTFGRRFGYLFATSLGAIMFWWAVISLGFLVTQRLRA
jgi:hypothetical protein